MAINPPTTLGEARATARVRMPARTSPKRLATDRLASFAVSAGGMAIIISILGILLFILVEIWPLFGGAQVESGASWSLQSQASGALTTDEYVETLVTLDRTGDLRALRLMDDGSTTLLSKANVLAPEAEPADTPSSDPPRSAADDAPIQPSDLELVDLETRGSWLFGASNAGSIVAVPVAFRSEFDDDSKRTIQPDPGVAVRLQVDEQNRALSVYSASFDSEGSGAVAAQLADGELVLIRREVESNPFSGETTESVERATAKIDWTLSTLLLDNDQRYLYGGTQGGRLIVWPLRGGELGDPGVSEVGAPVTELTLLIGDRSLVVGRGDGQIDIWFPIAADSNTSVQMQRVRSFGSSGAPIVEISPSRRDKGFVALDAEGNVGLFYSTSHRTLWQGASPLANAGGLLFAPRADAALVSAGARVAKLKIDNPHPEVSLGSVFAPVWYEGAETAEFVWQSSSGSDDFEPKLSLTPLMFGTLKGTFYSLIIAIPLAIFGAMYASQFMHPDLRRVVKPTVEIMAALPSVVLGFLAGLWLAPRLEQVFPALLLMCIVLPLSMTIVGLLYARVPRRIKNRFRSGSEVLIYGVVLSLLTWFCIELSGPFEELFFAGSFPQWLYDTTGAQYDQRNAIVVGLAMGFAVIPIIFSVAEDAFSNVPRNLTAGSLAVGATRWQTVTRVVLPTASPGIFSAVMIGFGRAVGETMIVLMATGNTPIMQWSPFNGFRTLSANIAVEIPEAPHAGTLYRMLFLAAFLLFVVTFVINTAAELVRQRLRNKYANL